MNNFMPVHRVWLCREWFIIFFESIKNLIKNIVLLVVVFICERGLSSNQAAVIVVGRKKRSLSIWRCRIVFNWLLWHNITANFFNFAIVFSKN